jgi:hypothetical protein
VSYKIEISGLFKALDAGEDGARIIDYLSKASSKPIPENISRTWEGWIEKSKKVRIREVTLMEIEDPEKFRQWGQDATQAGLVFKPLEGCAAAISPENSKKIKRIIEKSGRYVTMLTDPK